MLEKPVIKMEPKYYLLCFFLHILGAENRYMYLCLYSKDIHYHIIGQCLEK